MFILLNNKHGSALNFKFDSRYKAQTLQYLMIVMQHHLDLGFLNVLIETEIILQRFLQDIQIKHGFYSLCNYYKEAPISKEIGLID